MEDTLREIVFDTRIRRCVVLILVLMEDTLRASQANISIADSVPQS